MKIKIECMTDATKDDGSPWVGEVNAVPRQGDYVEVVPEDAPRWSGILMKDQLRALHAEIREVYESSVPPEVFIARQRATPGSVLSAISLEPGDAAAVREHRGALAPGLGFDLPVRPKK